MRYAVINAGGSGTRLWPLSRGGRPKQLLSVGGGKSLLRLAYERLLGLVDPANIYVCAGEAHREAVLEHLTELPRANVIGEPIGRDTAAAIGLASALLHEQDPDAVVAFVTSDHVIEPVASFQAALRTGFEAAEAAPATLVTFGIPASYPHTGLGYIERGDEVAPGVFAVDSFREKPDAETAASYVANGGYLWNAGTFVWRAATLLSGLDRYLPQTGAGVRAIAAAWSGPSRDVVLKETYESLRKISIDYAVTEPAARDSVVVVVPMSVDWLDVGSWPTLASTLSSDDAQNAYDGVTVLVDSEGNIVVNDDPTHLVATVGLHEMIIVHTRDVTMVCPKSCAERVKELVARVQEHHGPRYS